MATPTADQIRGQLDTTHGLLLDIHKALIDYEKGRYEAANGAVGTPNDLLQLIIRDPFFAWLRPMTSLLVEIDEFVSARPPRAVPSVEEGVALLGQARALLVPREEGEGFQRAYARALQDSAEVAHTHGAWKLFLTQLPAG